MSYGHDDLFGSGTTIITTPIGLVLTPCNNSLYILFDYIIYKFILTWAPCVATLVLGSRPKQGLMKVRTKRAPKNHISCSWECKGVWGNKLSHSPVNSHFESWSPNGFPNFQRAIARDKTHWIEEFFISLESYWNIYV